MRSRVCRFVPWCGREMGYLPYFPVDRAGKKKIQNSSQKKKIIGDLVNCDYCYYCKTHNLCTKEFYFIFYIRVCT